MSTPENRTQATQAPAIPPIPNLGTRTDEITIYAGPCSIESVEQFDEVAACVAELGLHWIRGGAALPLVWCHDSKAARSTPRRCGPWQPQLTDAKQRARRPDGRRALRCGSKASAVRRIPASTR